MVVPGRHFTGRCNLQGLVATWMRSRSEVWVASRQAAKFLYQESEKIMKGKAEWTHLKVVEKKIINYVLDLLSLEPKQAPCANASKTSGMRFSCFHVFLLPIFQFGMPLFYSNYLTLFKHLRLFLDCLLQSA